MLAGRQLVCHNCGRGIGKNSSAKLPAMKVARPAPMTWYCERCVTELGIEGAELHHHPVPVHVAAAA